MFCFACTGGIGSGKSYVIRIFSALGIPAFIADERVKDLYNKDSGLLDKLVGLLGDDILKEKDFYYTLEVVRYVENTLLLPVETLNVLQISLSDSFQIRSG